MEATVYSPMMAISTMTQSSIRGTRGKCLLQTSARCMPVTTPSLAASLCISSPSTVASSSTHSNCPKSTEHLTVTLGAVNPCIVLVCDLDTREEKSGINSVDCSKPNFLFHTQCLVESAGACSIHGDCLHFIPWTWPLRLIANLIQYSQDPGMQCSSEILVRWMPITSASWTQATVDTTAV